MAGDGGHIENGDLIRLLDGECPPEEEARIRRHLQHCEECRRGVAELEQLSDRFRLALQHGDGAEGAVRTPVRARRWPRRRLLQAAAIFLVVAVAASPARGWLVEGWHAIRSLFVEAPTPEESEGEPVIDVGETTAVVTFAAADPDFSLEVASTQRRGTVAIAIDSVPSASARVLGGDGSEELVVLPGGLRIHNTVASTASYEILLPLVVRNIEVRIAGRTVRMLDETALATPTRHEFELAPSEPNR
jgi:hypothetical protein